MMRTTSLIISSRLDQIEPTLEKLAGFYGDLGFDQDSSEHIELALREALANAILHGNKRSGQKKVGIEAALLDRELAIRIFDQGQGFDPAQVPDPRAPENLLKPSGRGILLMKSYMDRVEFHYLPGGGMAVTLGKRLPPRQEEGMKSSERERGGVKILTFEGPLTIGGGDLNLRDTLTEALDQGARKLLIDLSRASKIDSSGIGELVAAYTRVSSRGGKLKLLHLSPKLKDLLTITQLIKVFEIYEDETEAIASFG